MVHWRLNLKNKRAIQAEKKALNYLKTQNLILVDHNYACQNGELDLIMLEFECLVFVEVRFRSFSSFGHVGETITLAKKNKLRKVANFFLQKHPEHQHRECRFDAVLLTPSDDQDMSISWLQGVF